MSIQFPVTTHINELPVLGFTLNNLYNSLIANLKGKAGGVLLESTLSPTPSVTTPWFDGASWNVWKSELTSYQPVSIIADGVKLSSAPTQNRVQTLQAQDGVIALLDDLYNIRPTITLQEGLVSVDWNMASSFIVILSGDRESALYMINSNPGMSIRILLVNSGTSQTVTWDSAIKWQGGTAPPVPVSKPGTSNTQLVTLRNINGVIYAEYTNQACRAFTQSDASGAVPSLNTGGLGL